LKSARSLLGACKAGKQKLGVHISGGDPQMTEMIGNIGIDFFWIDTEHSMIDKAALLGHLIAARAADVPAFVRIAWNDRVLAKPILDAGVQGMIFPMVNSAKEAEDAVKACLYPPDGVRGFGPGRAIDFGLTPIDEYIKEGHKDVLTIVQIETREAVECVDEIAAVPGLDIVAVGPGDLSGAFGKLNRIYDTEIQKIFAYVIARAHAADKPVLISSIPYDKANIKMWMDLGADMITAGGDYSFIMNGAATVKSNFSQLLAE